MIYIYGASDDLIEIEGDIREEFSPSEYSLEGEGYYIGLSNGSIVKIKYDGDWTIRVVRNENGYDLYPAGTEKAIEIAGRDYTDVVELDEDILWAVGGTDMVMI